MLKVVIMALVSGIALGITVGFYYAGVDVEGIMLGLISIICIVTLVSFSVFYEKKRVAKYE